MKFNPERFNDDDAEIAKVSDLAFGFGRRLCPGKNFAENSLFAVVSTVLASCHILPGVDERGAKVIPEYVFTTGIVRCVLMSPYEQALMYQTNFFRSASLSRAVFRKISPSIYNHDLRKLLPCFLKLYVCKLGACRASVRLYRYSCYSH